MTYKGYEMRCKGYELLEKSFKLLESSDIYEISVTTDRCIMTHFTRMIKYSKDDLKNDQDEYSYLEELEN